MISWTVGVGLSKSFTFYVEENFSEIVPELLAAVGLRSMILIFSGIDVLGNLPDCQHLL